MGFSLQFEAVMKEAAVPVLYRYVFICQVLKQFNRFFK